MTNITKFTVLLLATLVLPACAQDDLLKDAIEKPPLDRKHFEDLALANNPTLRQAAALVDGNVREKSIHCEA